MKKIIACLVSECSKIGRYDKDSCLFYTRLLLSFFLWMNISTLSLLILGRKTALRIFFYSEKGLPIGFFIFLTIIYIGFALAYPKKKMLKDIGEEAPKTKRVLIYYYSYVFISTLLMTLAGVLTK